MRDDFLDREYRKEAAFERLGTRQPRCQYCNESNPFALQGIYPDIVCYECAAKQAGRAWTEDHHPAGRRNDSFAVKIPGNDHRVLSVMQDSWPKGTLRNPNGSPLLAAAAKLRGWLNVLDLIIERTVGFIPAFLELLDERLREEWGDRWWDRLGLEEVIL
jgi:hypothetical protein